MDPNTDDIVQIRVQTGEPPQGTGYCTTFTRMDFRIVQIGDIQFLLPVRAGQRFVYRNGEEVENTTTFANCREYLGESTIRFSEDLEPVQVSGECSVPAKALPVPAGLRFALELTTPIQTDTAAAGDPFAGKLIKPLRDARQELIAPAGSMVEGHLLRVASIRVPRAKVILVLKPETIEIHRSKVPLSAVQDWTQGLPATKSPGKKGLNIILPLHREEHSGTFQFRGKHVTVSKGFRSDWRTAH